jgi:hypothetical protein
VPSRALVLEVATGKVTTLYESLTEAAWEARFDGNVIELNTAGGVRRYNLAGSGAPPAPTTSACTSRQGGIEIAGRQHPDVPACGTFSPDGRWMTFQRDAGEVTLPGGARVPSWDEWVLDVSSGATKELQKGLVHCGGCDVRYGPRWSPTSRYVVFAEYGGQRRFLSDVTTGKTRLIGEGASVTFMPRWAPMGNRIVYSTTETIPATARFEDLDRAFAIDLPIAWPVAFDATGLYLYSPAFGESPKDAGKTTTVVTASTFSEVASFSGTPPSWLPWRPEDVPVAIGPRGVVAALQGAAGCEGTSITVGSSQPVCVPGGTAGFVNSTSSTVAVAKVVSVTGPARGPGFETVALTRYTIELFDVASGQLRTGIPDVLSWDYQAPVMVWNSTGTHLLVLAPSAAGI